MRISDARTSFFHKYEYCCILPWYGCAGLDVDRLRSELKSLSLTVRDALIRANLVVYSPADDTIQTCSPSALPALECINTVLFDTMGFAGNVQDYYDPKNRCVTRS